MEKVVQPKEVLLQASRAGARAAELLVEQSTGFEAIVEDGQLLRQSTTTSETLSVLVWLEDGRCGQATGKIADWSKWIGKALAKAETASPNAFAGPVKGWATAKGGLGVDDRRYDQLSAEDRVSVVLAAARDTREAERRADTTGFRYTDRRTRRILANTRGVLLQEFGTTYSALGGVTAAHVDLQLTGGLYGRTFSSVSSIPYGVLLANRLTALLEPQTPVSGTIRVFLPARVTAHIFGVLAPYFTEESLSAGKTFLSKQWGAGPLFDHRILLLDDGTSVGGLRTRSFDDRGAAPVPLTLIREGVVDRCFLSAASARAKDTRATGHATRKGLQPTNLQVRGGTRSLNALMAEMDETVLMIDHLRGFDAALKMRTGDFSCLCSGLLMHKGKVTGVVRNATLSGNVVEMFSHLVSLSSDTDRFGHIDAPGLVVDGLQVNS